MPIENRCRGLGKRFPARGSRMEGRILCERLPSKSFRIIHVGSE